MELNSNNQRRIIGGMYRHPNGHPAHFTEALNNSLKIIDNTSIVTLAGDFNIDLININDKRVEDYLTTLLSYKFIPVVNDPKE